MICLADIHKVCHLRPFTYNKEIMNENSIHAFHSSTRHFNDKNNKTRENIIGAIINNKVHEDYYLLTKWLYLKINISKYLKKLSENYVKVECINKAGRNHKYDFLIKLFNEDGTNQEFMIELKFNVSTVDDAPQFVSPMKPSQFTSKSFEEDYYENGLRKLSVLANLEMPPKEEYMKRIHSTNPQCMKVYQDKYYRGCHGSSKFTNNENDIEFYHLAKEVSKESIRSFINTTELDAGSITRYLQATQKNKIYMLYSNKTFILQQINIDDYTIDRVVKNADKYRYECISTNGKKINVLLRWKNGNGIAFPAFQIS